MGAVLSLFNVIHYIRRLLVMAVAHHYYLQLLCDRLILDMFKTLEEDIRTLMGRDDDGEDRLVHCGYNARL